MRVRVCMCACMCFLSASFSSSTHGCCGSEIPILMPFPSLITAAAVPLWSHFINKTCCQSDCKDSLAHFLTNSGFNSLKETVWLNVRESEVKWENSGVTFRCVRGKQPQKGRYLINAERGSKAILLKIIFLFFCAMAGQEVEAADGY